MTDEVMVPMAIIALALMLYAGVFTAAKEWVQSRIGGGSSGASTSAPSRNQSA